MTPRSRCWRRVTRPKLQWWTSAAYSTWELTLLPPPARCRSSPATARFACATDAESEPPDGKIVVEFAPYEDWPGSNTQLGEEPIGVAEPRYEVVQTGDSAAPLSIRIVAGHVFVDPEHTGGTERLSA